MDRKSCHLCQNANPASQMLGHAAFLCFVSLEIEYRPLQTVQTKQARWRCQGSEKSWKNNRWVVKKIVSCCPNFDLIYFHFWLCYNRRCLCASLPWSLHSSLSPAGKSAAQLIRLSSMEPLAIARHSSGIHTGPPCLLCTWRQVYRLLVLLLTAIPWDKIAEQNRRTLLPLGS